MDDTKKLEKIQKCLRLSKSANTNEASIALRQAQKLMADLGIDEEDLERMGYGQTTVDTAIQCGKNTPIQLSRLVSLICKAFGVDAVCEPSKRVSDYNWTIRYFGPKNRLPTAQYAHQVLYRAMEGAWTLHVQMNPHLRKVRGYRSSFQTGWLAEVSEKVERIGFTQDEEAIVKDLIASHYGHELKTVQRTNTVYKGLNEAGRAAAKDFSIHRPMDGKSQLAIGA